MQYTDKHYFFRRTIKDKKGPRILNDQVDRAAQGGCLSSQAFLHLLFVPRKGPTRRINPVEKTLRAPGNPYALCFPRPRKR